MGLAQWTRREFLRNTGLMAAGAAAGQGSQRRKGVIARPQMNLAALEKWVDPLPIPPVLKAKGQRPHPDDAKEKAAYYRIAMRPLGCKVHRDMKPTAMWGYLGSFPGPTLEARSGEGVFVEWANELPTRHFLPIDYTVHGADREKPEVRVVSHLHGGKVPTQSDGYQEDWYVPGKSATYFYPNRQDAAGRHAPIDAG